jgi:hypothetical protein
VSVTCCKRSNRKPVGADGKTEKYQCSPAAMSKQPKIESLWQAGLANPSISDK